MHCITLILSQTWRDLICALCLGRNWYTLSSMVKAVEARGYWGCSPSKVGGLASGHYHLWMYYTTMLSAVWKLFLVHIVLWVQHVEEGVQRINTANWPQKVITLHLRQLHLLLSVGSVWSMMGKRLRRAQ